LADASGIGHTNRIGDILERGVEKPSAAELHSIILKQDTLQGGQTQLSTDDYRDRMAKLKDLCTAGEPKDYSLVLNALRNQDQNWDFTNITQARNAAKNDPLLQFMLQKTEGLIQPLYDIAPSWTLETDILGIKDASGTTLQPGMLDIINNMPRGNTATVEQNKDCLSAILNTREVLLDGLQGQSKFPEWAQEALDRLNKLAAETAQAMRQMGYGVVDTEDKQDLLSAGQDLLPSVRVIGSLDDSATENTRVAQLFQSAMLKFLLDKNPAVSLDGQTQLAGIIKEGKNDDILDFIGTNFTENGIAAHTAISQDGDNNNRNELRSLFGIDANTVASGINDLWENIFFIQTAGRLSDGWLDGVSAAGVKEAEADGAAVGLATAYGNIPPLPPVDSVTERPIPPSIYDSTVPHGSTTYSNGHAFLHTSGASGEKAQVLSGETGQALKDIARTIVTAINNGKSLEEIAQLVKIFIETNDTNRDGSSGMTGAGEPAKTVKIALQREDAYRTGLIAALTTGDDRLSKEDAIKLVAGITVEHRLTYGAGGGSYVDKGTTYTQVQEYNEDWYRGTTRSDGTVVEGAYDKFKAEMENQRPGVNVASALTEPSPEVDNDGNAPTGVGNRGSTMSGVNFNYVEPNVPIRVMNGDDTILNGSFNIENGTLTIGNETMSPTDGKYIHNGMTIVIERVEGENGTEFHVSVERENNGSSGIYTSTTDTTGTGADGKTYTRDLNDPAKFTDGAGNNYLLNNGHMVPAEINGQPFDKLFEINSAGLITRRPITLESPPLAGAQVSFTAEGEIATVTAGEITYTPREEDGRLVLYDGDTRSNFSVSLNGDKLAVSEINYNDKDGNIYESRTDESSGEIYYVRIQSDGVAEEDKNVLPPCVKRYKLTTITDEHGVDTTEMRYNPTYSFVSGGNTYTQASDTAAGEPLYTLDGATNGEKYILREINGEATMLPAEIGGRLTGELIGSLDIPLNTISEVQTITIADSVGIALKHADDTGKDCYTFLIAGQENITITAGQIAELPPDKQYLDIDVGTTGLKARVAFDIARDAEGNVLSVKLTSVKVLSGAEDPDAAAEPAINFVADEELFKMPVSQN
jgi:hypothetical protein